jgi:hypothetical protein
MATELFFNSYTREYYNCLRQALLERWHLIILIQGSLYVLAKLDPRELPLDLVNWVFQVLVLLNILEEHSS